MPIVLWETAGVGRQRWVWATLEGVDHQRPAQCPTLASYLSMPSSRTVLRLLVLRLLHESGGPSSRLSSWDYEHHT